MVKLGIWRWILTHLFKWDLECKFCSSFFFFVFLSFGNQWKSPFTWNGIHGGPLIPMHTHSPFMCHVPFLKSFNFNVNFVTERATLLQKPPSLLVNISPNCMNYTFTSIPYVCWIKSSSIPHQYSNIGELIKVTSLFLLLSELLPYRRSKHA